jgi:hypothetical protein
MNSQMVLKPERGPGRSVTLVTQVWEMAYPNYPALSDFYNSGAFLYPYRRRSIQP